MNAVLVVMALVLAATGSRRAAGTLIAFAAAGLVVLVATGRELQSAVSRDSIPARLTRNAVGWSVVGVVCAASAGWQFFSGDHFTAAGLVVGGVTFVGVGVACAVARRRWLSQPGG